MFLPEYKEYYDRLLVHSERYVLEHRDLKGNFKKLIAGETDEVCAEDYRNFAFTKGTRSLCCIISLLEDGNYEDALILSRSTLECYLSARYLEENNSYADLAEMICVPIGMNAGALICSDGTVQNRDGSRQHDYDMVDPCEMAVGKDKLYFNDLYSYLCELAHCNISQLPGYADSEHRLALESDLNLETANLLPLFIYCKLFENVALSVSVCFETEEEEQEAETLLIELTVFLYRKLHDLYDSLEKDMITMNHTMRDIAHDTMVSLKEQTGRVDKTFVLELEKEYQQTPFEQAVKKSLLNSEKPSESLEELRQTKNFEKNYPELSALIGLEQNPVYHPEGDVWTHTMQTLDRAACWRKNVSDPYSFMLLALTHDFGKAVTTERDENGVIHSIGHEIEGVPIADGFLQRATNCEKARKYVLEMIPYHMQPARYAQDRSGRQATDRMFASVTYPEDLIYFAKSDKELSEESEAFLWERYGLFTESAGQRH